MFTSNRASKSVYQHYAIVAVLLLLTGASVSLHQFKVPVIMEEVANSVSMATSSAPWLMSIFTVAGIFFAIPAGAVVQHVPSKTLIIFSVFCTAVGSCLGAASHSGEMLLFSRFLEGVGFLMISVAGPVAVSQHVQPLKLGSAMGIWAIWVSVGQILAFNITPALFPIFGWRSIWLWFAAFSGIMAIVVLFGLRTPSLLSKSPAKQVAENSKSDPVRFKQIVTNKNLIFASIGFIVFNYLLIVMVTFFPQYAVASGRMDLQSASFAASLPMICCLIGSPAIGKLSDRFGYKRLYILCLSATGVGIFLMFAFTNTLFLGILLLGLIGLATPGMMYGSVPQLAGGAQKQGLSMGLVITFQNLGMFLGTATYPLILQMTQENYQTAALGLLLLSGISIVFARFAQYEHTT